MYCYCFFFPYFIGERERGGINHCCRFLLFLFCIGKRYCEVLLYCVLSLLFYWRRREKGGQALLLLYFPFVIKEGESIVAASYLSFVIGRHQALLLPHTFSFFNIYHFFRYSY